MSEQKNDDFKFTAQELMYSISYRMETCIRQFYEPFGLTTPQAMIILYIHRNGRGKVTEVANHLHMTNSNLSTICRRLERDGFLIRTRDLEDQRIVWLSLTEHCEQRIREIDQKIDSQYLNNLNGVSKEDGEVILAGLTKLNEILCRTVK
ncbi:MAG: MarR family transcriptional regulator [Firmicutes bacterium]|nr:MarR family transcriptional regulator [Bacillota bacterium]